MVVYAVPFLRLTRRITKVIGRRAYLAGQRDRYGNLAPGWGAASDFPVYAISPKQSVEEDSVGRRPIISGRTVYAPIGSVVNPLDRFVIDGVEWDVEGEPGVWSGNPHGIRGAHDGIQFDLKRSEG